MNSPARRPAAGMLIALAAAWPLAGGAVAAPGDFPHYSEVPRTFTLDPERWAEIFLAPLDQRLRICMLGDSQETSPGGWGQSYLPNLNYRFWTVYGNCPETPLLYHMSYGNNPYTAPSDWLWSGASGLDAGEDSRLDPTWLPPAVRARAMLDRPPQAHGFLLMLQHNARNVADLSIPREHEYFRRDGDVVAEFVAATNPVSGEINWEARPVSCPPDDIYCGPNYGAPLTGSGTIDLDLAQPGDPEFRLGATPPLDYGGELFMAIEDFGTSAGDPTDILGLRFRNLTHPAGLIMTSLSAGGMRLPRLLSDHADMGACLAALDFDVFMVHLGTNDAFSSHLPASRFRDDLLTLIGRLRDAYADPALPVIIAIDVHRANPPQPDGAEFDQQAGAAWEIAQADGNVLLLNLRRITEEDLGWGPKNESFLQDLVHLNIGGQADLAEVAVRELVGLAGLSLGCPGDVNGDGEVDVDDLVAVILAWNRTSGPADLNRDGIVDVGDLIVVVLDWGECG